MFNLKELRVGLFVPLDQPRFLQKAPQRGADAIVLDLEDSIAPERKAQARAQLAEAAAQLRAHGLPVLARVNLEPALLAEDLRACAAAGVDTVLVPKQEHPATAAAIARQLEQAEQDAGATNPIRMLLLVETPMGVLQAAQLAAAPRCAGLVFGPEDYSAALGVPSAEAALRWPAYQVALAARAHGLAALGLPASGATLDAPEDFTALAREARGMGFTGSLCIHPAQVQAIRAGFLPSAAEVEQARAVVQAAAAHAGQGAFSVNGRMVDAPVVEQARRVLAAVRGANTRP